MSLLRSVIASARAGNRYASISQAGSATGAAKPDMAIEGRGATGLPTIEVSRHQSPPTHGIVSGAHESRRDGFEVTTHDVAVDRGPDSHTIPQTFDAAPIHGSGVDDQASVAHPRQSGFDRHVSVESTPSESPDPPPAIPMPALWQEQTAGVAAGFGVEYRFSSRPLNPEPGQEELQPGSAPEASDTVTEVAAHRSGGETKSAAIASENAVPQQPIEQGSAATAMERADPVNGIVSSSEKEVTPAAVRPSIDNADQSHIAEAEPSPRRQQKKQAQPALQADSRPADRHITPLPIETDARRSKTMEAATRPVEQELLTNKQVAQQVAAASSSDPRLNQAKVVGTGNKAQTGPVPDISLNTTERQKPLTAGPRRMTARQQSPQANEPLVQIGRIDVFVQSAQPPAKSSSAAQAPADLASRYYLRHL